MMEFNEWVGLLIAIGAFLFGFYKWNVARQDKRNESIDTTEDKLKASVNIAQDKLLQEHSARLDRHSESLRKLDELISLTREEMNKNYPRLEQIEKMEDAIKHELEQLHIRLSGIARDLNQAIGSINSRHENQLTNLVEDIRNALEKKGG